jgi:glyoxylase-like metal-dependent hydrolase (beta-lactamase superfamily II)
MEQVELASDVYHLQSGSNLGLVVRDGQGLLIDTGLDGDAGRRALRIAEGLDVTLTAIVVTHAHADHFGGAHDLQRRLDLPLYAPTVEASMVESPIIEPLYLFGGASPLEELRGKFTLAEPARVDHVVEPGPLAIGPFQVEVVSLPGHALNQIGVAVSDAERSVFFCADALFPAETIRKHKVTFCVDLDETLATLERLPELPYDCFAPGHGPAYEAGEEIAAACAVNRERLMAVRERVEAALEAPLETPGLVQEVADHFGLRMTTPTAYFLTRTTVLAALSSLEKAGEVEATMEGNRLLWKRR